MSQTGRLRSMWTETTLGPAESSGCRVPRRSLHLRPVSLLGPLISEHKEYEQWPACMSRKNVTPLADLLIDARFYYICSGRPLRLLSAMDAPPASTSTRHSLMDTPDILTKDLMLRIGRALQRRDARGCVGVRN